MTTKRLYNLDLIRIIAMLMIVTLHFLGKGGILSFFPRLSWQYDVAWFVEGLCLIAVNAYVLISGYLLVDKKFKVKKIILLCGEVLFYSISLYALLLATGKISFSIEDTISAFLPILTGKYWFITAYVGMYILSPFMNRLIYTLNKKDHAALILTLVILFSIWPTVFYFFSGNISGYMASSGYSVVWFVVLYFIAAFIRRYYQPDYKITKRLTQYICCAITVPICLLGSMYLFGTTGSSVFQKMFDSIMSYNSFPVFLSSISFFILLLNIKIEGRISTSLIRFFAPLTLGVYLIHEEPHVRVLLWNKLNIVSHANSPKFILIMIGSISLIYISCSLIDYIRVKISHIFMPALFGYLGDKFNNSNKLH